MALTLVKRCPACGRESAPATLRCACGTILAGVDLSEPACSALGSAAALHAADEPSRAVVGETHTTAARAPGTECPAPVVCPHADCGQANDAAASRCLYCHRPLATSVSAADAWLAWPWGAREALRGELLVGRVPPAPASLIERLERDYDNVSRRHAMLRNVGGELAVEDLGSANGTYVDGVRLAAHRPLRLHPGATIRFGADLTATVGSEP